jgi:hypothetical protein
LPFPWLRVWATAAIISNGLGDQQVFIRSISGNLSPFHPDREVSRNGGRRIESTVVRVSLVRTTRPLFRDDFAGETRPAAVRRLRLTAPAIPITLISL